MAHYEKFSKQGLGHIFAHVRRALTTFHHALSKAVEQDLGYEVSIMTGEATLRREQGLRGSIDILKYKAQKLAEEYATLKEKFQGSGLKLSAELVLDDWKFVVSGI